jgi:DNA-binding response OmpR family regulator
MARFLVVDDDHPTVTGMARLLSDDGHDVAPFVSGAEALDALSRESFDAVMTDLEMPHVDGHAVVKATREQHPHACLVVVTDRPEDHPTEGLVDAGVCILADKPLDYTEVTKKLSDCRARGRSGLHGRCHMRSRAQADPEFIRLRRK